MVKLISLILLGTFSFSWALDLELAKEGLCDEAKLISIPLDKSVFANSSRIWYNPLISKYELYRYAEDLLNKKADQISDEELKNLCPAFTINPTNPLTYDAFGNYGASRLYEGAIGDNNTLLWKVKGHEDWAAKCYITKSAEEYFVGISCWPDGAKTVSVNTNVKKLRGDIRQEIVDYIKSLGFPDKYLYELNYANCDKAIREGYCTKECVKNNYHVK